MRKTLRIVASILTVLVSIFVLASFVYRVGAARSAGERSSGAEYSILRNALVSMQSQADLQDQLLRNRLLSLYKGSERLLAAQVLDQNGLALWKIPSDSRYFAMPNDSSVRGGYAAPAWSTVVFTTPLDEGMRLTALYSSVRRADISRSAGFPLLVLAVWSGIFIVLWLLTSGKTREPILPDKIDTSRAEIPVSATPESVEVPPVSDELDEISELEESDETFDEPEILEETVETVDDTPPVIEEKTWPRKTAPEGQNFEESLEKFEEEIIEWSSRHPEKDDSRRPEAIPQNAGGATIETGEDLESEEVEDVLEEMDSAEEDEAISESEIEREDSDETLEEFEELNEEEPPVEPIRPVAIKPEPSPAPAPALIPSPAQEIAAKMEKQDLKTLQMSLSLSEPNLELRLADELSRGLQTEVALMLVHCAIASQSDPSATALSATVRDYIGTKDLVFELYKGGYAILLPSVDLGGALKMSEDLADVLAATLSLYRDLEGEAPVFIGISARSGREVDAYKLYREASTAVHKAFAGSHSRILAFRPKIV